MDPTLRQLVQYSMQELGRGVPEQALRDALAQQGWNHEWIEAAFGVINQNRNALPQQASSQQPLPQTLPAPHMERSQKGDFIVAAKGSRTRAKLLLALFGFIILVVAVSAYLLLTMMDNAEKQRIIRDNERRDDLSSLLADLSDYYVAHSAYPLREELNDGTFLQKNGFAPEAIRDPKWSAAENVCTKDNKPGLADTPIAHCYSYTATTSQSTPCNNKETLCTRMTVAILLEKEKKPYIVTFDQNSEIGE